MSGQEAISGGNPSGIANGRRKDGHRLPAELLHEIVHALPIARCFYSSTLLAITKLRPFILPRRRLCTKMRQAHAEHLRPIASLYKKIANQYKQMSTLVNRQGPSMMSLAEEAEIAARQREMQGKINEWNAEIEVRSKQTDEFTKAWQCSMVRGRIRNDDDDQQRNGNGNNNGKGGC